MEINIEKEYAELKSKGFNSSNLYIKDAGKNNLGKDKGLGVFAKHKILKDEIIEYCPSIVLDWKHKFVHDASLKQYAYWHSCECEDCKRFGATGMIPLGYGSIINTADEENNINCKYVTIPALKLIVFYAVKNIDKNEEILTWWGNLYYNTWCK